MRNYKCFISIFFCDCIHIIIIVCSHICSSWDFLGHVYNTRPEDFAGNSFRNCFHRCNYPSWEKQIPEVDKNPLYFGSNKYRAVFHPAVYSYSGESAVGISRSFFGNHCLGSCICNS